MLVSWGTAAIMNYIGNIVALSTPINRGAGVMNNSVFQRPWNSIFWSHRADPVADLSCYWPQRSGKTHLLESLEQKSLLIEGTQQGPGPHNGRQWSSRLSPLIENRVIRSPKLRAESVLRLTG